MRTCVLDDLDIQDVGFMKIDVEGHEYSVLKGAIYTIERYKPNLMIELDDRYNPGIFDRCTKVLRDMGYEGFFILKTSVFVLIKLKKMCIRMT